VLPLELLCSLITNYFDHGMECEFRDISGLGASDMSSLSFMVIASEMCELGSKLRSNVYSAPVSVRQVCPYGLSSDNNIFSI
jgi:hypothetical protein